MNNQFVSRITPAEALKFSGQEGEFIDIGRKATEIAQYCEVFFLNHYSDGDPLFRHFCTMQAVFNAGRIQGIREERSRRKGTESGAVSPTKWGTDTLTTREKVKEAAEVLTDKQIRAVWKFMQSGLGIDDISVRTYAQGGAGGDKD